MFYFEVAALVIFLKLGDLNHDFNLYPNPEPLASIFTLQS